MNLFFPETVALAGEVEFCEMDHSNGSGRCPSHTEEDVHSVNASENLESGGNEEIGHPEETDSPLSSLEGNVRGR